MTRTMLACVSRLEGRHTSIVGPLPSPSIRLRVIEVSLYNESTIQRVDNPSVRYSIEIGTFFDTYMGTYAVERLACRPSR